MANGLLEIGVQKGDRVAVLLHNGPEFIEIYFACARSGAIFVPINNLLKEAELARIIEYIKPRCFLLWIPISKAPSGRSPEGRIPRKS